MNGSDILEITRMLDEMAGSNITGVLQDILILVALVAIVVGAIQCFFGYRLFRFFTAVSGFVTGTVIGALIGALGSSNEGVVIFCALVFGVIGALLAYHLYKLGIFITCYSTGSLIGLCLGLLTEEISLAIMLSVIGGLLLGLIGVMLIRPVIILCTGIGGGLSVGAAFAVMGSLEMAIGIVIGAILAIFGCMFQFGRKNDSEEADAQPPAGDIRQTETVSAPAAEAYAPQNEIRPFVESGVSRSGAADPGYTPLTSLSEPLWAPGLPILVKEAQILRKNGGAEDEVFFSLGFQNLSSKTILGVFFDIRFSDLLKAETCCLEKFAVQDVTIASGKKYSIKNPVRIPDGTSRRYSISVRNVVFEDESVWKDESGLELTPVGAREKLVLPSELKQEFYRQANDVLTNRRAEAVFTYQPRDAGDHWMCACGQMNLEEACLSCGTDKETIFRLADETALNESYQARLEEEQRIREERQQKIEAQKEAIKQFASGVAAQTGAALKKGGEMAKNTSAMLLEKGKAMTEKAGPAMSRISDEYKTRLADAQRRTVLCSNCGAHIDADSKFCEKCGAKVEQSSAEPAKTAFCPNCGKKLTADSKFCDGCGAKVQ